MAVGVLIEGRAFARGLRGPGMPLCPSFGMDERSFGWLGQLSHAECRRTARIEKKKENSFHFKLRPADSNCDENPAGGRGWRQKHQLTLVDHADRKAAILGSGFLFGLQVLQQEDGVDVGQHAARRKQGWWKTFADSGGMPAEVIGGQSV